MTLRFNILGLEVARIHLDIDLGGDEPAPGEPLKSTPMDKVADYFTRRFVKRRLL